MRLGRIAPLFAVLLSGLGCRPFAPPTEDPIKARLVVESSTVASAESFRAGVLFEIPPGWHLYWKEPGDIGLPTEVSFSVPEGFSLGEVQWPKHKEFIQGEGLRGLGYEDAVLLFAEIKAPDRLSPGGKVTIGARAKWLSCGPTICIPDEKEFSVELLGGSESRREHRALFDEWSKKL